MEILNIATHIHTNTHTHTEKYTEAHRCPYSKLATISSLDVTG